MWNETRVLEPAVRAHDRAMNQSFREKIVLKEELGGRFQNLLGLIGAKIRASSLVVGPANTTRGIFSSSLIYYNYYIIIF